jgi:hypothetical protein
VNQAYNDFRVTVYRGAGFDGLRASANRPAIFDRAEMGKLFWISLLFGAPGLFFYFVRDEEKKEQEFMQKRASWFQRREGERLRALQNDQGRLIEEAGRELKSEIQRLKARVSVVQVERSNLESENKLLKARMEFSPLAAVVKAKDQKASGSGSGGVLDGELL